ncbi:MAG: hypothetical protein LBB05_01240 [Puniceicoccales bacterium]|jgi:hypothetical protein|nr:hypothetical protein [Puniceicoccales bacterium]
MKGMLKFIGGAMMGCAVGCFAVYIVLYYAIAVPFNMPWIGSEQLDMGYLFQLCAICFSLGCVGDFLHDLSKKEKNSLIFLQRKTVLATAWRALGDVVSITIRFATLWMIVRMVLSFLGSYDSNPFEEAFMGAFCGPFLSAGCCGIKCMGFFCNGMQMTEFPTIDKSK